MVTMHGSYAQFRLFRPNAKNVSLVGDFNSWNEGQIRMVADKNGYWVAVLKLTDGLYKFRYLVDGEWYADYAAFGLDAGPFGMDSVLRVTSSAKSA